MQQGASPTLLSMSAQSDAEALLRKARELRAQAEADESTLHTSLINKKKAQDDETDNLIQDLFPLSLPRDKGAKILSDTMEKKRLSVACLKRVVERLHKREVAARGLDHVEPSLKNTQVTFERVSDANEQELKRVDGLIQMLIEAAAILDEKHLKEQELNPVRHHVDDSHWASGKLSETLAEKAHFLGREHEDQFKDRLQEYYEAAKKKDSKHVAGRDESSTSMFP